MAAQEVNQVHAYGNTSTMPYSAPTAPVATGLVYPVNTDSIPVNHLYGYNPKRYSGKILRKFYETCVLTQISNTDYEGEIKAFGDTVIIRTTPDIVVEDYKKGQDLTYRVYDTDTVELTIDKGKYWAFTTNPIDIAQTDIKSFTEKWTSEASLRMKIAIEKDVYAYLLSGVITGIDAAGLDANNKGATAGKLTHLYNLGTTAAPRVITNANVVSLLVDAGSVLAEQDIPVQSEECWAVIDQKCANLIANSELKEAFRNGTSDGDQYNIPKLDCFSVYRSNILPQVLPASHSGYDGYVIFGHKSALTFASQITENEILPNPHGFGKLHRGLMVYGFQLVMPKAFGFAVVKYGAIVDGVPTTIVNSATNPVHTNGDVTVVNGSTNPVNVTGSVTTEGEVTIVNEDTDPVPTKAIAG